MTQRNALKFQGGKHHRPTLRPERFTRDQWDQKIIEDLKFLVAFLNFQFDDRPTIWQDLRRHQVGLSNSVVVEFQEETFPSWKRGALVKINSLRAELLSDLTAVLKPIESTDEDHFELQMLVRKLNQVLRSEWIVEPFSERIPNRRLTPYEGILVFGEQAWTVRRWAPSRSLRQRLYWILSVALESGEFNRLMSCKNCNKFFVADHANRELCSVHCSRLFFARDANDRKSASRSKKAIEEARLGIPKLARISTSKLDQIRALFGEKFEDFIQIAEGIKKGNDPSRVWATLPPWMKKKLARGTP